MKMRLPVHLWTAVAAVTGVVVMAERRVEQRKVVPPFVLDENPIASRSHPLPPLLNRQSWARGNIYHGHYPQKEPDTSANYWTRRARGRYRSSGASSERRPYTATGRHESREPQPRRVYTTSTTRNAASRDSLPTTRSMTSTGERLTSNVHQVDPQASTDNHRQYPYAHSSHGARVLSIPRDDMPQRSQPDRRVGNHYRASSSYDNTGEIPNPNRPLEGHPHSRHRVHDPHPRPGPRADLSMVSNVTRDFPEGTSVPWNHRGVQNTFSETRDEAGNSVRQRLDQPELCCGSRVPLDPRVAVATGAFQRVAAAGSIKVVEVPGQHSFPPNEVRDLRAESLDLNTLSLTWTAPGEDLDSGTASGYIIRLSEEQHDLQESHFDAAPEETLLETSESLAAAGVYQTAGTRVVAEVMLRRQLERGHVYYVALKALDSGGLSSGVSNVARFSVTEFVTEGSTASHPHATAKHYIEDQHLEEYPSRFSQETTQRRREMTIPPDRTYNTPSPRSTDAGRVRVEQARNGRNSNEPSLPSTPPPQDPEALEPDGPAQQKKREGKKNRRRKKNKSKRRRNDERRNGRRRDRERQGTGSETSVWKSHVLDIYAEMDKWNES